jgi:Domain of unknown function (DUF4390)
MKAVLAFLGLLVLASQARAEAEINGLRAVLDGDRVVASFTLTGGLDGRLSQRIDSGLPTSIVYEVELHKDRKRWYDNRLDRSTLEVMAVHDAVARTYSVHLKLDGELIESRTVRDREALVAAMTRIDGVPVFTLGERTPRGRLLIKVRAELGSRTILSFIPAAIHTEWKDSNKFRYPGRPSP